MASSIAGRLARRRLVVAVAVSLEQSLIVVSADYQSYV